MTNKEEILAKSRAENNNQDIYEKEVLKQASSVGNTVLVSLATLFFVIQVFLGGGINYGLYALVLSVSTPEHWMKYIKIRKKSELGLAIASTIAVITLSIAHIYNLVSAI